VPSSLAGGISFKGCGEIRGGKISRKWVKVVCNLTTKMATTNIYVLKLERGKWYVGKAADVESRYQQHCSGKGSAWTKKYAPVELVETIRDVSPFEEDKKTKELMAKHGIANVRGGTYVTEELTPEQSLSLKQEIWGAKDCCTRCGRSSHFVKSCVAQKDVDGDTIYEDDDSEDDVWECSKCGEEFDTEAQAERHEACCRVRNVSSFRGGSGQKCYRCGRAGHYANTCYANTSVSGYYL
jgi:predicted GIY-YIG superfamily endonuclease